MFGGARRLRRGQHTQKLFLSRGSRKVLTCRVVSTVHRLVAVTRALATADFVHPINRQFLDGW